MSKSSKKIIGNQILLKFTIKLDEKTRQNPDWLQTRYR